MVAVIMAGGKGTRLKSVASEIPKPMVKVCGKPVLEHQIDSLKRSGISEIILIIGHLGEKIKDYFKEGNKFGVSITYIKENEPLGTAGALYYLKTIVKDDFFLLFGDLMINMDWIRMYEEHKRNHACITLLGHPNSHPFDSDLLILDENKKVIKLEPKNVDRNFYYKNIVNAGVYVVNYKVIEIITEPIKLDFEKNIILNFINEGQVYAYISPEYVKDMGTIDRLEHVSEDFKKGTVEQKNLINKQRCIFIDRDGTINKAAGFIKNTDQFELIEGVSEAIRFINESQYLCIVITNQPVIARGECTYDDLISIHNKMETLLGMEGAYIDDLFFCPHHPHTGYEGEVLELKIKCDCRKPNIGMIKEAVEKYNIDLSESWFIGDTSTDIKTGINAGCKTVQVLSDEEGKGKKYNVLPDYYFDNLNQAVRYILFHEK